jgi:lysozyme family protein
VAKGNFDRFLAPLLEIEGGVADRPLKDDPGGLTNKGVTWRVYDEYRLAKGLKKRSVRYITNAEVHEIYERQYWWPIMGDDLPAGLDWAVFDFAVNSGPGRAVKELQRILGVNVDGAVGFLTLAAVNRSNIPSLIEVYCNRRLTFMRGLKNWGANKNGWTRRVNEVKAHALALYGEATAAPKPKPRKAAGKGAPAPAKPLAATPLTFAPQAASLPASAAAKAPEANQAKIKTPAGSGLSLSGFGTLGEKARQWLASQAPDWFSLDSPLGRFLFAVLLLALIAGFILLGFWYLREVRDKGGLGPHLRRLLGF